MRFFFLIGICLISVGTLRAGKDDAVSVSRMLDEIIVRPGDFDQICDAPPAVPFDAPPIPAYGLSVPQDLFLSDAMKAKIRARRSEVVQELAARLEKLDWLKPPAAPVISKKPLFVKVEPGNEDFDVTKPSGQNPRALGSIMLGMIQDLDAVELLPQLLRLEEDLHRLTQEAKKNDQAPLPEIDIGGSSIYEGMEQEFEAVPDWDKAPRALKRKKQLFDDMVFDRDLLGMMLQLLKAKDYAPLRDSTPGLLHVMALKKKPLDEEMAKMKRPEDIPENERRYILFDKDLGIPYWRYDHAKMWYSEALRLEILELVKAFVGNTTPPVITGAALLDESVAHPGGFNQMCMMPQPLLFDAPIPAYGVLAPRSDVFDNEITQKLQAHRQKVIPELVERLKSVDLSQRPVRNLNSSTVETVRLLHGIEALPELLRLEEQLHAALATTKENPQAPLPDLDLDSPVVWIGAHMQDAPADKEFDHKKIEFKCRIFQRELLGLIGKLLREEDFAPFFATGIDKEYDAGLRKAALEGDLKDIKNKGDVPYDAHNAIVWDEKLGIPVHRNGPIIKVPYTEPLRDELRSVAEEFLKTVPPEKRKGETAMDLISP